jgi:hypothetical protein
VVSATDGWNLVAIEQDTIAFEDYDILQFDYRIRGDALLQGATGTPQQGSNTYFRLAFRHVFHLPELLCSTPVTALLRYYEFSESCSRLPRKQVSLIHAAIPSPHSTANHLMPTRHRFSPVHPA